LIARDPATPIHLDLGGLRGSLVASLQSLAGPVVAAMDEVLGGKRTGRTSSVLASDALATATDAEAAEGTAMKEHAPSRRARLAGAASRHTSHLAGHHRLASLSACLLLVAVAAVGALPPVSAASRADRRPAPARPPAAATIWGTPAWGTPA